MLRALDAVPLSLCALPMDVTEHASDSSLTAVVQCRVSRSSWAHLEQTVAKQDRDGTLGRLSLEPAVLHPLGRTLKLKMPNTYSQLWRPEGIWNA